MNNKQYIVNAINKRERTKWRGKVEDSGKYAVLT